MKYDWVGSVTAMVVGGAVGVAVGVGLGAWLGDEVVALAAVRAIGWFLLGVASGRCGERVTNLRRVLLAFGVAAGTSWTSLVVAGVTSSGQVLVALIEVAIGLMFALIGHLIAMPKGPDL